MSASDTPAEKSWLTYLDPVTHLPTRFALVFLAAGVALTLVTCYVAGLLYERKIRETVGPQLENLAFQISDKFDRAMNERFRELQLASLNETLRSRTSTADEKRVVLGAHFQTLPDYAWIGFADPTGTVVAGVNGWLEGSEAKDLAWFADGMENPTGGSLHVLPALSSLLPGSDFEKPRFVAVSSPVFDTTTKFMGVIGAYINWSWVRQTAISVIPDSRSRDRLFTTVYDLNGKTLYDTHADAQVNLTEPLAMPDLERGREYRGYMLEQAVDGDYITGYVRSRGYQAFRFLNWYSVVRQPTAAAFAPVMELQRWIILTGFGLSLLLAAAGWIFARRFTRQLHAIAAASDRIREGDVSSLIPEIHSGDEVEEMATNFGRLVSDLKARNQALEAELARLKGISSTPDEKHPW